MEETSKRFDWHRVGFWGVLCVAAAYVGLASFHPDRRIVTVFEAEGRNELNKFMRFNFPETANWMGLNRNATSSSR